MIVIRYFHSPLRLKQKKNNQKKIKNYPPSPSSIATQFYELNNKINYFEERN